MGIIKKFLLIKSIIIWLIVFLSVMHIGKAVSAEDNEYIFPSPDRLNVLFISPAHQLEGGLAAETTLLESLSNIRFSVMQSPHKGGDHIVDIDSLMWQDPRWSVIRKAELLKALEKDYDTIILATLNDIDNEIVDVLKRKVESGCGLIWVAEKKTPEWLSKALSDNSELSVAENPLAGLGLEDAVMEMVDRRVVSPSGYALQSVTAGKKSYTVVSCGRLGKGKVIALASRGNSLFPVKFANGVDSDWLWAKALEKLVRFCKGDELKPAVIVKAEPVEEENDNPLEHKFKLTLTGPKGITVNLQQSDMCGNDFIVTKNIELRGEPVSVDITLKSNLAEKLLLAAVPVSGKAECGQTFVTLPKPLMLDLYTTRQGKLPDFETMSKLILEPEKDFGKTVLHWTVKDWSGKVISYKSEAIELKSGNKIEREYGYKLTDTDSRAYVSWLQACVIDDKGNTLAWGETPLYRYRPYKMDEQILVGTWHTGSASRLHGYSDLLASYLNDIGFNSCLDFHDQDVIERHNFRRYIEHGAATTMGVRAAPFAADIEGYKERYQAEGKARAGGSSKGFGEPGYRGKWPSASINLFSMGEETGFGNNWSESYPWRKEEAAPEECNKWFRYYLKNLYGSDLAKLNQAWSKEFKDWDEIKVWRKYAKPYGWLWVAPSQDVEDNLTPYVDTHAFHEWYVREYTGNYMKGYSEINPTATWTMSYDFTFLQFSPAPMTNFWGANSPGGVSLWHNYIRSRTPGSANPFHLNWMFFEDERMNNQFLQMGLATGCTYLFSWGHNFNGDLTPSRSTMAVSRTMKQVKRPESVLCKMTPHVDKRIGIYTLDSRWALVRGRYGFFTHRNGPYDVSLGVGPYQAPGASYLKPPELPLYNALAASGYAPKFVTPDEFDDCKLLILPYVEAISTEVANKVRKYVENGGNLVVFPTIAQYDEGGKPYGKYPGAGFDQLLGFTASPDWAMGRSQVVFPGENAATKAFEEAWLIGEKDNESNNKKEKVEPPLFFNMKMRIGGHPCHYMPEGRQNLSNLSKDVAVIGHHQDGNPLITYRKVGKGAAICFNILLTCESGLADPVTEATETFREVIDLLVRQCGVNPDFEITDTHTYNDGVNEFSPMQYDLPGTETRILTIFEDHRSRNVDCRLRLRPPFVTAYDVLSGKQLVTIHDPAENVDEILLHIEPGYWRVIALTTGDVPVPVISGQRSANLGEDVYFMIGPESKNIRYGRIEVIGPAGNELEYHGGSIVLKPDENYKLQLKLDDPLSNLNGKNNPWKVRYHDAISGTVSECQLEVHASNESVALAKADLPGKKDKLSRHLVHSGPELDDAEFLGLLIKLRERHLDTNTVDKRIYSYYSYEMAGSRQRTMQMLATADWTKREDIIAGFVGSGERLYLVCEDMGVDPAFGITTTPGRHPHILETLQSLVDRNGVELLGVSGKEYLRVIKIDKGMIVLDLRSPDNSGNSNLHLAEFHKAWVKEIADCGLAPGGKGTIFLPVGEETLQQWIDGAKK